ncbi:hypothetical protein [Paenibacillus sp. GCM10012303]|uniref:hypothetical protein n=1 Tax=Paenibacillus sp. GCM10012303 TaxID=3317340 RepID=UPI003607A0FC
MIKLRIWGLSAGTMILLLFVFLVPLPFQPPGNTRMILDHTHKVYVAPPCFNGAVLTNYLTETTWNKVIEKGYRPESACTAEKMEPVARTMWNKVWELAGFIPSPWAW